jgi:glutaconate CoA-transferase subunit B
MNDRPTFAERAALLIASELEDGWMVLTGAASQIPLAACLLAQATHAPRLTTLAAGVYVNPRRLVPEFTAGWDCRPDYVTDLSEVFYLTEAGIDVMFFGGMQIDVFGNANLHWVSTTRGRIRGPGLANIALGHTSRRSIMWTERHDTRTLVNAVDYASVVGHRWLGRSRSELALPNAGPTLLLTPEVVFRPDPDGRFEPTARFSDTPWELVRQRTGWELPEQQPPALEPPDAEVLHILRMVVDPAGLLRG